MLGFIVPMSAPTASLPPLIGWNMPGGEVNDATAPNPGTSGTDYLFPDSADINYAVGKGVNFLNFTFSWQQLQPSLGGAFNSTYQTNLLAAVNHALSLGVWVMVRPSPYWSGSPLSNGGGVYAGYNGYLIGASSGPTNAQFANLWSQIATLLKDNGRIVFDLINEPNTYYSPGQTNTLWFTAAQDAITAIRGTGSSAPILVEGNGFSGAPYWCSTSVYGSTSNCTSFLTLTDTYNNIYPCVHSYWDGSTGYGGTNSDISLASNPSSADNNIGVTHLTLINDTTSTNGVLPWAVTNGQRIFIGEMGVSASPSVGNAPTAVSHFQTELTPNMKNVLGFGWWQMGSSFYAGSGPYYLYPNTPYSVDSPNYAIFSPLLALKAL